MADTAKASENARPCSRTARARPKIAVIWKFMRAREGWYDSYTLADI